MEQITKLENRANDVDFFNNILIFRPIVAKFWNSLGVEGSRTYTTDLLHDAVKILRSSWASLGNNPGTGGKLIVRSER